MSSHLITSGHRSCFHLCSGRSNHQLVPTPAFTLSHPSQGSTEADSVTIEEVRDGNLPTYPRTKTSQGICRGLAINRITQVTQKRIRVVYLYGHCWASVPSPTPNSNRMNQQLSAFMIQKKDEYLTNLSQQQLGVLMKELTGDLEVSLQQPPQ
ncbi:hypothetical protein C1H46_002135 [Malus baccata]|uniref:Uncharacterized protein n=1 Tax=Malus baccata TaxID=106549 RepID=A0A540NNV7_MALBA|nr:hypothetical protein C1H46_002135 [Malus baccata]